MNKTLNKMTHHFLKAKPAFFATLLFLSGICTVTEAQVPTVTVRFANPTYSCANSQYCLDVEFLSDSIGIEVFGMNVRFFYDDEIMELDSFTDFQGGYGPVSPDPPAVIQSAPGIGFDLFGFGNMGTGVADFVNGAIQLLDPMQPDLLLDTTDWTKIFTICFTVEDPGMDSSMFCPPVVWDLEQDPANGGFLTGDDGVVITIVSPDPMVMSEPSLENVVQFNWEYIGSGTPPYGQPIEDVCISLECIPTIVCPIDVTIACDASTDPSSTGMATADTVCMADISFSFSDTTINTVCGFNYTIQRTWIVTNDCNESDSCIQLITLIDTVSPTVICPPFITINCDESTDPSNTGMAVASDNCDPTPEVTYIDIFVEGDCPQEYTIDRIWIASDTCGNVNLLCRQEIVIQDLEAPVITCPVDLTLNCDVPLPTTLATASDNCSPVDSIEVTYSDTGCTNPIMGFTDMYDFTNWVILTPSGGSVTPMGNMQVMMESPDGNVPCPLGASVFFQIVIPSSGMLIFDWDFNSSDVNGPLYDPFGYNINGTFFQLTDDLGPDLQSGTAIVSVTAGDVFAFEQNSIDCILGEGASTVVEFFACTEDTAETCTELIVRTHVAVDQCGNSSSCIQTFYLQDTLAPLLVCPVDTIIECTSSTLPDATGMASATDNCDTTLTVDYDDVIVPATVCDANYTIQRTWMTVDACGNTSTCLQVISVVDTTGPVMICPADTLVNCTEDLSPANLGIATATDNCTDSVTNITFNDVEVPGNCPDNYSILRTWTAVDSCGNSTTCLQTIMVQDTTNPVILCPADTLVDCSEDVSPANLGMATATDNCTDVVTNITFADVEVPGNCPDNFTIVRTWTAVDSCGNSSTCLQTIMVQDTTNPVILCPADTLVNCTEDTSPFNLGSATATDNCTDVVTNITFDDVVEAGSCADNYTILRTWTAVDSCGNSSTCLQTIMVQDTTIPVIICPADTVINCTEDVSPDNLGEASATDNCTDVVTNIAYSDVEVPGSCADNYTILRTWTAVDSCGNSNTCLQTIMVQDTTNPTILCPLDTLVNCTEDLSPDNLGAASATDNCTDEVTDITFADVEVPGNCPDNYTILRTWTAVDSCGNSSTCLQTITVQDTLDPIITCPADTLVNCTEDLSPDNLGIASATDNCTDVVTDITFDDVEVPGNCPDNYTILRTWTAVDSCGNSSTCLQTISVQDTVSPVITCPADTLVNCSEILTPDSLGVASATDNCTDVVTDITFVDVEIPGICPYNYTIERTWTAVDSCGNSSFCLQTIMVQDTTAPQLACPGDLTIECTDNTLPPATGVATATDLCDASPAITYADAIVPGECPQEYTINRTWTSTDTCGNIASCLQIISVDDSTPPTLTFCPDDITIECDANTTPDSTGIATATDNCGTPIVQFNDIIIPDGQGCPQNYQILRFWVASDSCGNETDIESCIQTITIQDNTPPVLSCAADTILECTTLDLSPETTGFTSATDNCSQFVDVDWSDTTVDGSCPQEYTITRTWIATDECGNSATCVQTILIADTLAPILTCPEDVTILCEGDTSPDSNGFASATDNCDTQPIVDYADVTLEDGCPEVIQRTWYAEDACGNIDSCAQLITVGDFTPPVIICPEDTVVLCAMDIPDILTGGVTTSDNCGFVTVTFGGDFLSDSICVNQFTINRVYVATDECGNSSTCVQIIEVLDTIAPSIVCPADITLECTEDTEPPATGVPTATDNCPVATSGPVVWINEFHYDNTGGDTGEFIEIAGTAGVDLSTYSLVLYNGSGGAVYDTDALSGVIDNEGNGYGAISFPYPANGIQNGAPDGIAFVQGATVIQFISYEGSFVAVGGPANGMASVDVGVIEAGSDPLGLSLSLMGSGMAYGDFMWAAPSPESPGSINMGQIILPMPLQTVEITHSDMIIPSQICPQIFTINRTWTAEDGCGNTGTCIQVIEVEDTQPPVITCPADLVLECTESTDTAFTGVATASDLCAGSGMAMTEVWINEFHYDNTGTDAGEFVEVAGTAGTDLSAYSIVLYNGANGQTYDTDVLSGMIDNEGNGIGAVSLAYAVNGIQNGAPDGIALVQGAVVIQFISYEGSFLATNGPAMGMMSTDIGVLEVGNEPLGLSLNLIGSGDSYANFTWSGPSAQSPGSLNIGQTISAPPSVLIKFSDMIIPSTICPQEYIINRTWTATDECGNSATCLQVISVVDDTPPTVTCPDDVTILFGDDESPDGNGTPEVTDNCDGEPLIDFSDVTIEGDCDEEYTLIRTWTATDACGNSSTCEQIIFVDGECIVDLSLIKDLISPAEVDGGDNVNFLITVTNEGEVTVGEVVITDYIPLGFSLNDPDWTPGMAGSTGQSASISLSIANGGLDANGLNPGESVSVQITLLADLDIAPGLYFNWAEISAVFDVDGDDITLDDIDSTPDENDTNDPTGEDDIDDAQICVLPDPVISGDGYVCPEQIATYTVSDYNPDFTYVWTLNGGGQIIEDNGSDITIAWQSQSGGPFEIRVDVILGDGCSITTFFIVYIQGVDAIACNDHIQISLDTNCQAVILSGMILEGENEGNNNYYVIVTDENGNVIPDATLTHEHIGGTFTVMVVNECNNQSCWGTVSVEDKIPPTLECRDVSILCGDALPEVPAPSIVGYQNILTTGLNDLLELNTLEYSFDFSYLPSTPVLDVDVRIQIDDHTWLPDVKIEVEAPNGQIVEIFDITGCIFQEWPINCTFDDEGGVITQCIDLNGTAATLLQPLLPPGVSTPSLFNFDGNDASGIWTVRIADIFGGDDGHVREVGLSILVNLPQVDPSDNCGEVELEYYDTESGDPCISQEIIRHWTATDESGNTSTCTQTITILPLEIDSVQFPSAYEGECGGSISPIVTGWPTINGHPLTDENDLCNFFVGYWDKELSECGGGRKIVRTWTVLDWCTVQVVEGVQVIKLSDTEGPVLTCPADFEVGTDFWYCYANVSVPKPVAVDACSEIESYQLYSTSGTVVSFGNNYVINGLELGTHTVTWTVRDECGNSSTCSFEITVVDDVVPVANCDLHTIVSLTNDGPHGVTLVPASVFDDGSYDNCGPVTFRARRMEGCIDFDWTTEGACIDDVPGGIPPVNSRDRGTVHRPCVPFACCDVGNGPIMVELEVTDAAGNVNYCMIEAEVQDKISPYVECPPDIIVSCDFWFNVEEGTFVDGEGNNNGNLDEDPLSAVFGTMFDAFKYNDDESVRGDIIINDPGNDEYSQPHFWGIDGWADDNCEVNLSVRVRVYDDCSGDDLPGNPPAGAVKLIERRFQATDGNDGVAPGTCTQRIWVVDYDPFFITDQTCNNPNPQDGVIWPCDVLLTTCPDDLGDTGEPTVFDDACSLIGVTYDDTRFDFVDSVCFKILREWSVIDWCQYDPQTGEGLWKYIQVIKVHDDEGPEFLEPCETQVLCVADPGVSLPDNNQAFLGEDNPLASSCSVHLTQSRVVEDACSDVVEYDVKIYPFNGTEYILIKPTTTATVDENGQATLTFDTRQSTIQSIRLNGLPYNSPWCGDYHRILWSVEDGCGNWSHCEYLFRLEDCKQPSPVCINGLSTVVMPVGGQVTIWAKDFNASSFDDCTPADELLYSFSGDTYTPSFTYTCDNVPAFNVEIGVNIWVADGGTDDNCNNQISWNERNKDFCSTTIVITDNAHVCGDTVGPIIGGDILTEDAQPVELVGVHLQAPGHSFPLYVTSENGHFEFTPVPMGQDYTITPARDDNHRNGVSTLDLVRIQKHLLGIEEFTSPYHYIAADANNSESISAIDIVEIRKLVLGIYTEFPQNTSWRFVEKGYPMDEDHPWPFSERITIPQMSDDSLMHNDFVGVKVGDVNNSVQANAHQILPRGGRRMVHVGLESKEHVEAGEIVDVTLRLPEDFDGFQWTLETRGLQFMGVSGTEGLGITDANVGVLPDGIITMSWHAGYADVHTKDMAVQLQFMATKSGNAKEMIRMTSHTTAIEAYTKSREVVDVRLGYESHIPEFALYQNQPNPWNAQTSIGFTIPKDGNVTLTVFDAAGKTVHIKEAYFKAGYNTILLSASELPSHGVLYYRLESGEYAASKKMVMIK